MTREAVPGLLKLAARKRRDSHQQRHGADVPWVHTIPTLHVDLLTTNANGSV